MLSASTLQDETLDLGLKSRIRQAMLQIAVTLTVLAWVPGSTVKAMVLLTLWAMLLAPLRRVETWMVAGVCLFFTGMNASALKQGIFLSLIHI